MLIISVGRQWKDNGVPGPYWLAEGLACTGLELLLGVAIPVGAGGTVVKLRDAQEEGRGLWIPKAGS